MRSAVRRSASARPGWLLDGDDAPLVAHQRGQVGRLAAGGGAQVEDPLAGPRVERARDRHRGARLRHEQALLPQRRRERVERRVERRGPRAAVGGVRGDGQALRSRVGRSQRVGRTAASAGSLPAAISARAVSGAERVEPQLGDPVRMRVAQRRLGGRGVGQGVRPAPRASRAARRRTALTSPAPRRDSRLASSTDSPTAACAGTRSRNASWKHAEPQRGEHGGLELARPAGRPASRSRGRASRGAGPRRRRAAWRAPGRAAARP